MFKKIILLIGLLLIFNSANAGFMGIVDRTATRDTIAFPFQYLDTLAEALDAAADDSVYIMVFSPGGVEVFRDSMAYNDGSITESAWEDFAGGNHYVYKERVSVLDGSSTADGVFTVHLVAHDENLTLSSHFYYSFQIVNSTLESSLDSAAFAQLNQDSIQIILDSLEALESWVAQNAYFDTLIYQHGVWVDNGANTNTVVGTDGTPKNPVGTIAAAKTIADALGFATIYFLDGASETIGATMEDYRFVGITRSATVNLGGQDVDGSFFECLTITGEQGGTGTIVVVNAGLTNVDSLEIHARNCAILGNLSLRAGTSHFDKCYSSVPGNATPVLDFNDVNTTVGVNWRAYSGGLELKNMTTDHTISYESDGQLVINANCDNGNISARGMMTITDNGTSMSITKDAVFSRSEADLWVWSNIDTTVNVDTSLMINFLNDRNWDEILTGATHNIATSAGRRLRQIDAAFTLATGQAQVSGTPTDPGKYIILAAATNEADDFFNHASITIDGGTGVGQSRAIEDYTGATDSATLIPGVDWITDPDATSTYTITPGHPVEIAHFHGDTGIDEIWEYDSSGVSGAQAMGTMLKDTSSYGGKDSVIVDVSAAIEANGLTFRTAADVWEYVGTNALVEDSTNNSTTRVQTNLAEVTDDHYNGMMVFFFDQAEKDQARRITDYNGTNGWVEWTPAITGIPNSGDVILILPWASVAGAGLTSADVDLIWDEDSTGHYTSPNMAFVASQTGASGGISDADMVAMADTILNRDTSDITTGFGEMMKDTSAYQSGAKVWEFISQEGAVEDSAGNTTTMLQTNLSETTNDHYNGLMIMFLGNDETYQARRITDYTGATGVIQFTPALTAVPSADEIFFTLPWSTVITDSLAPVAVDVIWDEDTTGHKTDPQMGFYITQGGGLDTLSTVFVDRLTGRMADTTWKSLLEARDDVAGSFGDSAQDWNNVGAGVSGAKTMTFTTTDTVNSSDIANIFIEIKDMLGNKYTNGQTNTSGKLAAAVDALDSFVVTVFAQPNYGSPGQLATGFDSVFINSSGNDTSITLQLYPISVAAPSGADLCRVFAFLKDASGNPLSGGQIIATPLGNNIEDTCSGPGPIARKIIYGNISDADSGFTFVDVIKSKCLLKQGGVAGAVKYEIKIIYGTTIDYKWRDTIPDQDTLRVTRY